MGVPISREILTRSWGPSNDDYFLYFHDGTTMDEYKSVLAVESTGCCVTKIEYAKANGIEIIVSFLILFIQWLHLLHKFVYYMNSNNKWICLKQTGNRWCWSYFQFFEGCRKIMWFWIPPRNHFFLNFWHFASRPELIQRHRFISITSNTKNSWQYRKGNPVVRSGLQYTKVEGGVKKTSLTPFITF